MQLFANFQIALHAVLSRRQPYHSVGGSVLQYCCRLPRSEMPMSRGVTRGDPWRSRIQPNGNIIRNTMTGLVHVHRRLAG